MAARVLSAGLGVEEFARALTSEVRLELVAALVRAEGFCWVCDGVEALAWSSSDNVRALERRKAEGWELTPTGCTGCDGSATASLERFRRSVATAQAMGVPLDPAGVEANERELVAAAEAPRHAVWCCCDPCTGRRSS